MSNPSPACLVNGSTPPQSVGAGSTVTISLQSLAGVNFWILQCTSTDETNSAATINASLIINSSARTATFTAPASLGSAVIFTSTVGVQQASLGAGYDANNVLQPSFTTTFEVHVATSAGNLVIAANEQLEGSASYGWVTKVNALIRGGVPVSGSAGGDLTGSYPNPTVKQLTGSFNTVVSLAGVINFSNGLASVTFNQSATSNATGSNFNISAQTSTASTGTGGNLVLAGGGATGATAGTPGNVVLQLGVPSGGGVNPLILFQNGPNVFGAIGYTGANSTYNGLYLGGNGLVPSASNYSFLNGGGATYLNGPSGGSIFFRINNAVGPGCITASGWQFGSETPSFGGGSIVLGLTAAGTLPTSVPTGGGILAVDNTTNKGLHYYGPSTSFVDFMVAPTAQGSLQSGQQGKVLDYAGSAQTTTNSAVTILTIPLATSATNAGIQVLAQGRDQTSGTVTDGVTIATVFQFKNVSGTVSQGATTATPLKANDTSMASCTCTATLSGTNILIQVTGLSSTTINWFAYATAIIN